MGLTAVSIALALLWSAFQTPKYEAKAKVLLQPRSSESLFDNQFAQRPDPARAIQTEIEILKSQPVRDMVRERAGEAPPVSARPIGQTDIIDVVVEHEDADKAARISTAYAQAYIELRRERAVDSLLDATVQIEEKLAALEQEMVDASGPERDSLVQQYGIFRQKADQLEVERDLKQGGAQLVAEAAVPTSPVSPKPVRAALFALVLGGSLGVGLALLRDYPDDSVKTDEDVQKVAPGLNVLGLIPALPSWKAPDEAHVVSVEDPSSPPAEAYRTLRTAVQFLALERRVSRIQFTSANAQEGKTTTLANLGVALARSGQRVALVCCDLRRPRIHEFFGLSNAEGFTSVLLGSVSLRSALQETSVDRLFLLASGPLPPNPSELLNSRVAAELIDRLAADGFLVLIDSPPLLPVTDAMVLAKRVDATLLVCSAGQTTRKELRRAVDLLQQVNAPLAGAVLNGAVAENGYGYSYGYYEAKPGGTASANGSTNGRGPAAKLPRSLSRKNKRVGLGR